MSIGFEGSQKGLVRMGLRGGTSGGVRRQVQNFLAKQAKMGAKFLYKNCSEKVTFFCTKTVQKISQAKSKNRTFLGIGYVNEFGVTIFYLPTWRIEFRTSRS